MSRVTDGPLSTSDKNSLGNRQNTNHCTAAVVYKHTTNNAKRSSCP